MNESSRPRLVTFLGKPKEGRYQRTVYAYQDRTFETEFVAEALSSFLDPEEALVLATEEAWSHCHGEELSQRLTQRGVCDVRHETIPDGRNDTELWQQFVVLKEALRAGGQPVALDITHGFRSQPFFAAGAVSFVNLVDASRPDIRVYYGAFEAKEDDRTPVWDLTPFAELVLWSSDLMLFLRTGRAAGVAETTERLGRSLRKTWAISGKSGTPPPLVELGRALARFGSDLETVRTGSLLLDTRGTRSSSSALLLELNRAESGVERAAPPLADVIARIRTMVQPLITTARLSSAEGIGALKALAHLYLEMGHYAEAAATMREAWVNQYACTKADCPGQSGFSTEHREAAEKAWFEANGDQCREVAQVRNDLEHGGYNADPMPPETIKRRLLDLIGELGKRGQSRG